MKRISFTAFVLLGFAIGGCKKSTDDDLMIPPGSCRTAAECQPMADRQQAYQDQLRAGRAAQGVHEEYLPCGKYVVSKAPNGFWFVTKDTAGCPATASQQDPYPDLQKAKQSKQNPSKGETPK